MEQAIQINARTRRSKQQIQDLLHEFEKTGTTVKDFCKLHNISTGNFHKWKSRYKVAPLKKNKGSGFAKLDVVETSFVVPGLFAEVKEIKIYQPVSASFLKELL